MIREKEAALKGELPEEVRNFNVISMRMLNASGIAQLDFKYQQQTGNSLLPDYFARTDDQTVPGYVASVGRVNPSYGFSVDAWLRGLGHVDIFAVSSVVLPRRLAV